MWKNHGWIKCNGFLTRLTLLVISLWSSMRVEMSNDQNHGHLNKTRNPYFLFLAVKEGFPKLSFDLLVLILCQGWMAIAWWKSCQRISSSRCLAYCLDRMISLWQEGPINFSLVVRTNTSRNEVSGHKSPHVRLEDLRIGSFSERLPTNDDQFWSKQRDFAGSTDLSPDSLDNMLMLIMFIQSIFFFWLKTPTSDTNSRWLKRLVQAVSEFMGVFF